MPMFGAMAIEIEQRSGDRLVCPCIAGFIRGIVSF